jgi:hypothetical protein
MSTRGNPDRILPTIIVGVAAAILIGFVYGYPRLFPDIEASQSSHFEQNVATAMAHEEVNKALRIARRATMVFPYDPMTYTVYGRTLLDASRQGEGLTQLNAAVNLREEALPESRRETRKPYYFAPARLTLGKFYLEQGEPRDAVANFELARAYANLAENTYHDYRRPMYTAYARLGLWARALEYDEPSEQELDGFDAVGLARIARICEGAPNWGLACRLADRYATRADFATEARYLQGRSDFAEKKYEASVANLDQAVEGRHPHAAFFLGAALEKSNQPRRAAQAYLRIGPEDVYRAFALAKALALLESLPENERALVAAPQDLAGQLDAEITALRQQAPPTLLDNYRRATLLAFRTNGDALASGVRFPIVTLWETGKADAPDAARIALSASDDGETLTLRRGLITLQLQWVTNEVNWYVVKRLPPGATTLPGWIDTARDWFHLRGEYAAEIYADGAASQVLEIAEPTWLYSVPAPVCSGGGYLLAARCKGAEHRASLGWQAMNARDHVDYENNILGATDSNVWVSHAAYMRSQLQWTTIRAQISASPGAGPILFDDVMLVHLSEPGAQSVTPPPQS